MGSEKQSKRQYDVIIKNRSDLTDYEKDQLIPELKSRLEALKGYFKDIVNICEKQRGSHVFTNNLEKIINPKGLQPAEDSVDKIAERFFSDIINQAKTDNIDDINRILNTYSNITDVKKLGLFLNEINLLCSSMLAVKTRLFLFKIEMYPYAVATQTGQTITDIPNQFFVTTEPFQIAIQNIIFVCKATSESIHEWHKYTMKMKTQFLDLYNNRVIIKNNLIIFIIQVLTIFLAIALSAFFLTANDPFSLLKTNKNLKSKIESLTSENQSLKAHVDEIKKKMETGKKKH